MAGQPLRKPEAYHGDEPFAFISYSHDDEALVYPEMNRLIDDGMRLYFDAGIAAGHTWQDELAEAIEHCQVFVLFVTPRSAQSNHCRREIHFALDLKKPIVAVHLLPTEMPGGLRLAIGDKQAILAHQLDRGDYERVLQQTMVRHLGATPVSTTVGSSQPASMTAKADTADLPGAAPPVPGRATAGMSSRKGSAARTTGNIGPRLRRRFVIPTLLVIAAAAAFFFWQREKQLDAALGELAAADTLLQQDRYGEAFLAVRPVADVLADDAGFQRLWAEATTTINPAVPQPDVRVRMRPYEVAGAEWIDLGTTPLTPVEAPRGVLLFQLEKEGFETRQFAVPNPGPLLGNTGLLPGGGVLFKATSALTLEIAPPGTAPEGMVTVPATDLPIFLQWMTTGLQGGARYPIPAFAIGRREVSNREYKAFVDAGGYTDPGWWQGMTLPGGAQLSTDTIATFTDASKRPGPSTWELGTYPAGTADLPVGGISWYEAVAFARFRGLALPTLHHWVRAAFAPLDALTPAAPAIGRMSNFEGEGPLPVDSDLGVGPWGTVNTAGNVREWVWNRSGDEALILGGAWSDYPSLYSGAYTTSLLNRAPQNGLRLMHTLGKPVAPELLEPVTLVQDSELSRREPVSDDAFEAMRFQFTHAPRQGMVAHAKRLAANDTWTADEVVLTSAGAEPFTLFVVKPVASPQRLQPVIYMPHGGAQAKAPNDRLLTHVPYLDFIMRSRRALIMPVWAGTLQRVEAPSTDPGANADRQRRGALAWYEDAATTIDYLQTRDDMDSDHIGFLGNSFGAMFAPVILSQERRFAAAALIAGGTYNVEPLHPMIDGINYAPRVTLPVLMINGRNDHLFLYEPSQKRLFDLLGTPADRKRQVMFDSGHFEFPRNQVGREVTDWFDAYLGPVSGGA